MIIQLEKKYVVLLIALIVGLIMVSAFGTNNPVAFGHSTGELANGTLNGNFTFNDSVDIGHPEARFRITNTGVAGVNLVFGRGGSGNASIIWQNTSNSLTFVTQSAPDNGTQFRFSTNNDRGRLAVSGNFNATYAFDFADDVRFSSWDITRSATGVAGSSVDLTVRSPFYNYTGLYFNASSASMGLGGFPHPNNNFRVLVNGTTNVTSTLTVGSLYSGAATGKVVCVRTDGSLGVCTTAPAGTGECTCA